MSTCILHTQIYVCFALWFTVPLMIGFHTCNICFTTLQHQLLPVEHFLPSEESPPTGRLPTEYLFLCSLFIYILHMREIIMSLSLPLTNYIQHATVQILPCSSKLHDYFSYDQVILHCIYVPSFLYPLIYSWTLEFLDFGYCRQCYKKHRGTTVFSPFCFWAFEV